MPANPIHQKKDSKLKQTGLRREDLIKNQSVTEDDDIGPGGNYVGEIESEEGYYINDKTPY